MGDYTIRIFTDIEKGTLGRTFSFQQTVDTVEQANAHAHQILKEGYRRQVDANTFDWVSPHHITMVRIIGPSVPSGYNDSDVT